MNVKIFATVNYQTLEDNINNFLCGKNISVHDIKFNIAMTEGGSPSNGPINVCSALIMYDEIESLNN